jgi:hypothetical protein
MIIDYLTIDVLYCQMLSLFDDLLACVLLIRARKHFVLRNLSIYKCGFNFFKNYFSKLQASLLRKT